MVRPALLDDPERATAILDRLERALASACSIGSACSAAGISETAYYEWQERGKADLEAGRDTIWAEFAGRVSRARRQAEDLAVAIIRGAAEGWVERRTERIVDPEGGETIREVVTERRDWRAAAWMLERQHPAVWGAQQTIAVEHRVKTWNVPGLVLPSTPADLEHAQALAALPEPEAGAVVVRNPHPASEQVDPPAPNGVPSQEWEREQAGQAREGGT